MPNPPESKAVRVSQQCYELLLAAYPRSHRREYGFPMAQFFRDQSRDAWREARAWGLVWLWLRVLPDLVKTSFLEHLAALKGRKSMAEKISEIAGPRFAPLKTFFGVAVIVFLVVFGLSALITFLLPESYASTARIKVERNASDMTGQNNGSPGAVNGTSYDPYFIQTEFEVIRSEVVLSKVIESLDLNTEWGKKYAGGEKLKSSESLELLKSRMDLRPVRNTSLMEIRVFSEGPAEAARIANAVAEAYREYRQELQSKQIASGVKQLKEHFDAQEAKVLNAQKSVDQLRRELNISDIDAVSDAPVPVSETETIKRLQGELFTCENLKTKAEIQLNNLLELPPDRRRYAIQATVGSDNELSALLNEVNMSQTRLLVMANNHGPDHPDYNTAKLMADHASNAVNARIEGTLTGLSNQVAYLGATVKKLRKELDEARESGINKSERSRPYYEAKVRLQELERFRSVLNMKLASEQVDASLPKSTLVEIVDRAAPGLRPVRPNKPLNLVLGALGGMVLALFVGGGAAFIRSLLGKKVPPRIAAS